MRIAIFTDTYLPQVNGVSRTLARLVRCAEARGDSVALVTPRIDGPPPRDGALHLRTPSVPVPFYPELRLARPLDRDGAERLDSFGPDLVHVATEFTVGWSGTRWARERDVPLVTSFHTNFPAYLAGYGMGGLERPLWHYLRTFHERALLTFCPSRATRDELRERGFHDRLRIWSRGVDAMTFRPERRRADVRERLAPGADRILLYVGRLAPEKRVGLLLEAFRRAREQTDERVALVVVGDGPQADELRADAPSDTHFTGYLSGAELANAYAAGDVFAFPSDTETFGNVVLEAMSSGLPVIGAAAGGVTDTIEHGSNGLLVPPGDPDAFADAVLPLVSDGVLRARMAHAARATALGRSWTAIFDRLFEDYRGAIERRRALAVA